MFFTFKMTNGGYFQWTSAVFSEKDVVKQGMNNSKSFKNVELNWLHSSIFVYTKSLKNVSYSK